MMTEAPNRPLAHVLGRHLAMVPVWALRYRLQSRLGGPPTLITIGLDALLTYLYLVWVNRPLERTLGARFAVRGSQTWHLETPLMVAAFFLIRDIVFAIRGTSL